MKVALNLNGDSERRRREHFKTDVLGVPILKRSSDREQKYLGKIYIYIYKHDLKQVDTVLRSKR